MKSGRLLFARRRLRVHAFEVKARWRHGEPADGRPGFHDKGDAARKMDVAIAPPGRRQEPLHVVPMALALTAAAFGGGALGLVWQSTGLGGDDGAAAEDDTAGLAAEAPEEE